MGLLYCKSAFGRLKKTLHQVGVTAKSLFEPLIKAALGKALHRTFPDFQIILNMRGRLIKTMTGMLQQVNEDNSPHKAAQS